MADPYPATAYSPNNPTYVKTTVAAIEYPNIAIVIGIDWKKMFFKKKNLALKWSKVICLILLLFNIFIKITNKDTNWAIKVAIPIPVIPNGGINKKPKIKIGFKIIFKKKANISTFL
mgnify:FL=1